MQPVCLSRSTLNQLAPHIAVPRYDPAEVTPGIVHLGLGNFHRAHMARYTHELMNRGGDALHWGIIGAGLLPADRAMHEALEQQDRLYTLIERDGETEQVSVIGSICGLIHAGGDSAALIQAIAQPEIRIVSLTITEHGYCLDRATRTLDFTHPLIAHDLAVRERPRSAVGILVEAARRRRDAGVRPFTALSCDNIQHNGAVLRRAALDLAQRQEPSLAEWIEAGTRFPNTMVDRITPVTQAEDVEWLKQRHGLIDARPVFAESFTQWVIEDDFADGGPAWEDVGAQFVADVTPHEIMKLRLLNASHLAIAGLGGLIGYRTIDETMRDEAVRSYMRALMDRETGPTLLQVRGIDLPRYKASLIERFANPAIRDTVERVNSDAPLNYLLDPLRDRLAKGRPMDLLALAVAAWMRRVRGVDEQGRPIEVKHPLAALLRERAEEGSADPRPLLAVRELFGDLGENGQFVERVGRWLRSLYEVGAAETLRRAL